MPKPVTIQNTLIIGETYNVNNKKMKLIGKTKYFGRFERPSGIIECFLWTELINILK